MLHVYCICLLNVLINTCQAHSFQTRHYSQSQGKVWPKPWKEHVSTDFLNVDPTKLQFNVKCKNCAKIHKAIRRCKDYIETLSEISNRNFSQGYNAYNNQQNPKGTIKELQIHLSKECEEYPHFDMNEGYNLTVSNISTLNSSSVWGIIRGMETLTQLFYLSYDYKKISIRETVIVDKPNYVHRALLLDTSRHYLSVQTILTTLDAMAMNKMNVFHWHIVDDPSFPYRSTKLPGLNKAAFHPTMIYTKSDLEKVRDYASDLGIRVMMEIDMPGHSAYWEVSYPEILTECPQYFTTKSRPLNPLANKTYSVVNELLQEIQDILPDKFFHLGGDEVDLWCWSINFEIVKYLWKHQVVGVDERNNNITNLFFKNVLTLLRNGTIPVVWEEVFNSHVELPPNAVVQTWISRDDTDTMVKVLQAGLRGIQSSPYYLDEQKNGIDLMYQYEPRLAVKEKLNNDTLLGNLLGGTACMWGELVDDTNVISRVWPRASGMAEVLWSETNGSKLDEDSFLRIEEHTCRMRRRGVHASPPLGSGFCIV